MRELSRVWTCVLVMSVFAAFVLLLAGCATGVTMTDAEQAACKEQGCSAWTMHELRSLAARAFQAGHAAGYAAGVKSL